MTLEEAIVAQLKTVTAVTDVAGTADALRIYPNVIPQAPGTPDQPKYPAATYRRISGPREHTLQGRAGLASPRIEFTCWAKTYAEATQLRDAISSALDGFSSDISGPLGGENGLEVSPILAEDGPDTYDVDEEVHGRQLDLICWHAE